MQENWIGKSRGLQFSFRLAEPVAAIDSVEVFTTRPDTIFGASFVAVAADHPIAQAAAAVDPAAAEFIAECKAGGTSAAEIETAEKKGFGPAIEVVHPLDPDMAAAGLHRELRADGLWHRRDFRRSRPRPARLRVCEAISSADQAGGRGKRRRRVRTDRRRSRERAGSRGQLRSSSTAWPPSRRPPRSSAAPSRPAGARARSSIASATGAFRASVIGARRSRSSTARRAGRCRCRASSCRSCCPRTSASTCPATRSTAIRPGSMSTARPAAAAPRARPTRSTPSSIRAGISSASRASRATARSTAPRPSNGFRSANISAGSSMRSCTCSTPASGPARCSGWASSASPSRSAACSPRAW